MRRSAGQWVRTALVLALLGGLVGASAERAQALEAHLYGFDSLAAPGAASAVYFRVMRKGLVRYPLPGLEVEFASGGQSLGRVQTRTDGMAELPLTVPSQEGDYLIEATLHSSVYSAPAASLLLAVRGASARIVVVDVARTIADADFRDVAFRSAARVPPIGGAVAALTDISSDALVVYLVGHDDYFAPDTYAWLGHWGFPRGVAIFSKEYAMLLWGGAYKAAVYQMLAQGWSAAAGFGNEREDLDAAQQSGVPFFAFGAGAGLPTGTLLWGDWDGLRAANRAGRTPALSWARSFR